MHTLHTPLNIAHHTLQRIDFDPLSFQPADLLWLPHHRQLAASGRKRQTEHLAGRIAAIHALREVGEKSVPQPGAQGQPLWPAPWFGSISHCDTTAIAAVSPSPIGIDIERIFSHSLALELASSIINDEERRVLNASGLPFSLALTLAFSAKESAFKAYSTRAHGLPGFASAEVVRLDNHALVLRFLSQFSPVMANNIITINWLQIDRQVITCSLPCNEA